MSATTSTQKLSFVRADGDGGRLDGRVGHLLVAIRYCDRPVRHDYRIVSTPTLDDEPYNNVRLGSPPMRRLLADRLVFATGTIVILLSVLFALLRVVGW